MPKPPPKTTEEKYRAYEEALRRIEQCLRAEKRGTHLDLREIGFTTLPPEIAQLSALTTLSLDNNQLTTLPPEIAQLSALTSLSLGNNQLTTLPPEIAQLSALTTLYLQNNQLTTLPPEIAQLSALTSLSLHSNQLTTLPPEIAQLSALTSLSLQSNQLTTLPPEIAQLSALTSLSLQSNQLTTLPPEIAQLSALTSLSLSYNQLTTLPPEIAQLSALTWLSLHNNQLTTLPPEIAQLSALTSLSLHSNQLTTLPPEIAQLSALTSLFLHDNPGLGLPVEVLGPTWYEATERNPAAKPREILGYYFRIHPSAQQDRGRALQEARIILIGDGAAGKTSVVRQLLRGEAARQEEASTRDVVVAHWPMALPKGKVQVNVWDFGGQKQMHAAHPYFFTTRTLYLVVAEARKDQQDRVDYWLKMVAKFGGGARALVLINKVEPQGHSMALDRPKLLGRYQNNLPEDASAAFFPTSCTTGKGIAELRLAIERELNAMDQVWALWPLEWFKAKQSIQQMREPQQRCPRWLSKLLNFLPSFHQAKSPGGAETLQYNEWKRICDECGVEDQKDRDLLLERLGDLGLVIAFPKDANLRSLGVLNPEWVTRGIYPLLVDTRLAVQGGLLKLDDLSELLPPDRFPIEQHDWLVKLMTAFELVFKDSQENLLLPAQLPVDSPAWAQPAEWIDEGTLHLELRYDAVLPESVISQFIVRRHADARRQGEWWRHGIALRRGNSEALVRAHTTEQEAKIELRLRGPRQERHALLHTIRETLRDPRDSTPPELHVILGPDCAQKYNELLIHAAKGLRTLPFIINGVSVTRELAPILDMIETPSEQAATQQALTVNIHNENKPAMNQDDHSIHARDIINSQVGQTLTNCNNMIQLQAPGEAKALLETLERDVKALIPQLPGDQQGKAAKNLTRVVESVTEGERPWYDVSAKGLLEAAGFVGDFAEKLTPTLGKLAKVVWPG